MKKMNRILIFLLLLVFTLGAAAVSAADNCICLNENGVRYPDDTKGTASCYTCTDGTCTLNGKVYAQCPNPKQETKPTDVPPTAVPPTAVPPTAVPPTAVPPTAVPPTAVPPTAVPPTAVPPTAVPPTAVPVVNEPEPVQQSDPEPVKQSDPEPVRQSDPEPVQQNEPEPVWQNDPQPVIDITNDDQNTVPVFNTNAGNDRQTEPVNNGNNEEPEPTGNNAPVFVSPVVENQNTPASNDTGEDEEKTDPAANTAGNDAQQTGPASNPFAPVPYDMACTS